MSEHPVITRRRRERDELIARARQFAEAIPANVGLLAAAVFGSVARGDFNVWSDIDVVVVAREFPERLFDRYDALGRWPAGVQPVPWTPAEWRRQLAKGNPIATEAVERGVWLLGTAEALADDEPAP